MSVIGHCFRITSGNENNGVSKKTSGFPLQGVVDLRAVFGQDGAEKKQLKKTLWSPARATGRYLKYD